MEPKYVLLIFTVISNIFTISSNNINSKWPRDDSKPFPYPTRDPININPFKTPLIRTPKPLTLSGNSFLLETLTNTGFTLLATIKESLIPATATGGVLYDDLYILFEQEYFWDLSLNGSAGITYNGFGAPVQIVTSFYNQKYGTLKKAKSKRDGIFQEVTFIYVGPIPNPKFIPLMSLFPGLKKAGSSIVIPADINSMLIQSPSIRKDYYAYPGEFYDHKSGKTYFSSTVIAFNNFPPITISYEQFELTFGSLESKSGKPFSRIARQFPKGRRPVRHVVFSGLVLQFKI